MPTRSVFKDTVQGSTHRSTRLAGRGGGGGCNGLMGLMLRMKMLHVRREFPRRQTRMYRDADHHVLRWSMIKKHVAMLLEALLQLGLEEGCPAEHAVTLLGANLHG